MRRPLVCCSILTSIPKEKALVDGSPCKGDCKNSWMYTSMIPKYNAIDPCLSVSFVHSELFYAIPEILDRLALIVGGGNVLIYLALTGRLPQKFSGL